MAQQRQLAMQYASEVIRSVQIILEPLPSNPATPGEKETARLAGKAIDGLFTVMPNNNWLNNCLPALQATNFTDIKQLDDCTNALTQWNNLMREAVACFEKCQQAMQLLVKNKFETFNYIQQFIIEIAKVTSRAILRLGQLASPAGAYQDSVVDDIPALLGSG